MKGEDTKQKILTEALRLFAERGYNAATVEEIAKAVGIKAPSLYKHYKSKRDIFLQIVERMHQMDAEQAENFEMPGETSEGSGNIGHNTSMKKICAYSKSMFRYWTENSFAADFRKLLTIEQYHDAEMAKLYQEYLAAGPIVYMTRIFRNITASDEDAEQLALEFYGPMHLLYSVYDGTENKERVLLQIERYIDRFMVRLEDQKHTKRAL